MKQPLIPIVPSAVAGGPGAAGSGERNRGWPLLRLGFRPFYLGAASFGALAIPLWVAVLGGAVEFNPAVNPVLWHAHEMLFGFAVAVIIGFLLTAGKAWTGMATPRGFVLGALASTWLAARVAALAAPYPVYAVLDVLLLPVVAVILAVVLVRAGSRRNLPLVLILLLLAAANGAFHLAMLGLIDAAPVRALYAGLGLITMIESVIAGRVVPAFTQSATPGLRLVPSRRLDAITLAVTAIALAGWVFATPGPAGLLAFGAAAALHAIRQARWRPWVTRGRPILWILHVGYAWIPVGLALLGLAQVGWISASAGVHALAVGATGGLIIGMMTRTARGHTGRPLKVSRIEVAAYSLVIAAAGLRVLLPLVAPQWFLLSLVAAAVAWSVAFSLYLLVYGPWLMQTRLDGKDG